MSTQTLPDGAIEIPGTIAYIDPVRGLTRRPDWRQVIEEEMNRPATCGTCGETFPSVADEFFHDCERLASVRGFIPGDASQIRPSDDVDYRPWGDGEPGSGTGRGRHRAPLSDAQGGLIERLLHEIDPLITAADVMDVCADLTGGRGGTASALIDDLFALKAHLAGPAPAPAPLPAGCRPNRYAGNCRHCGQHIAEQAGLLCKDATGRWTVEHNGTCPTAPAINPVAATVPEGHYALPSTGENDLVFYRVDRPTEGAFAGRVFVKMIVGGKPDRNVRRDAIAGILARIEAAGPDAAGELYGQEIGRCWKCNRHLTDEASRAAGIGPDCATRV